MNKLKIDQRFRRKVLVLMPLAVFLFIGVACVNGQAEKNVAKNRKSKTITAVAPVKMNVLYVGVENPINVAVSGYESSEINVVVTNGAVYGENGEYIVRPKRPGNLMFEVRVGDELIQETHFRVKDLPHPVAMVNRMQGGEVQKESLLKQDEVFAFIQNFDFDLSFRVISFSVTTFDNKILSANGKSNSNTITDEQKEIIRSLNPGSRIIFDNIKAEGPDGAIRNLSPIVFTLI